jgi:lipase
VTQPAPKRIDIAVEGVALAIWEWPGEDPAVVFTHGTGFHGRCWDQVIRRLPGCRALAWDARGHGRSGKPDPPYHWRLFRGDLVEIATRLGITGAIGVGHSMGGHTIASAAADRPGTFSALLLVDPIILQTQRYGSGPFDASVALRRRDRWPSPQAMFESFRNRPPFDRWQPEVLRDYCDYGLLADDGEFRLACPPYIEAATFEGSVELEADLHPVLSSIHCPVTVLRAGIPTRGFLGPRAAPIDPLVADCFSKGRDVLLPGHSHFIPMEAPELVAEQICETLSVVR